MKAVFRGIFLTSENPQATACFYQEVAGLDLEAVGKPGEYVYWKIDKDGMQLAVHDARLFADYTNPPQPGSNLTHLYFKIESTRHFLEHLQKINVTPYCMDDVVITVVDPDGRKVMFGSA